MTATISPTALLQGKVGRRAIACRSPPRSFNLLLLPKVAYFRLFFHHFSLHLRIPPPPFITTFCIAFALMPILHFYPFFPSLIIGFCFGFFFGFYLTYPYRVSCGALSRAPLAPYKRGPQDNDIFSSSDSGPDRPPTPPAHLSSSGQAPNWA